MKAFVILTVLLVASTFAQQPTFTRADSLRGGLRAERTSYDVRYYHLDVRIDPSDSTVRGSNTIVFTGVSPSRVIQADLFENMPVGRVTLDGDSSPLPVTREFGAMFIRLPRPIEPGRTYSLRIEYGGRPQVAVRPPWDGGFTWTKDPEGHPWVAVTCQGTGASLWWPNKDHQEDEPDSMLLSVTIPPGLQDVSNGRLRSTTKLSDGWTRFDWFISYPINNYNVTVNIGKFAHWSESYGSLDPLTLDYYVLPGNLEAAKKQFAEVKPMMEIFERAFGPYPFRRDGYKLVESPHLGMEHQTAVAYGNHYLNGYRGRASSPAGVLFDFIILHESAHEWWGNHVTSTDVADMWIHESFGAYAEAIYVEGRWGKEAAMEYVNGKKPNVRNDRPIIGTHGVQYEGSGDMYDKGQLVLNTLRHVINDDSTWFRILRGLQQRYRMSTVTGDQVFATIDSVSGEDHSAFYQQYFRQTGVPRLSVAVTKKGNDVRLQYRWTGTKPDFRMPAVIHLGNGRSERVMATNMWQSLAIPGVDPRNVSVDETHFYVVSEVRRTYIDERAK
jgi:aminopeptidase N